MTDYWIAYPKILPKEKHIQSKAETFRQAQCKHSLLRDTIVYLDIF